MSKIHKIQSISFNNDYMLLHIDNQQIAVKLTDVSSKLSSASDKVRNDYTISPSGYGIHWSQQMKIYLLSIY